MLSQISVVPNDSPSMPSQVIPGGETSPATTFALYAKGAKLPQNSAIGSYEELPLDDSCAMPTTKSEVYLKARELENRVAREKEAKAKAEADEAAAKQAEIDRKVKYYDEHYAEPQAQPTLNAGAQPAAVSV